MRKSIGDYLHHLSIANGSLMELETHLLIATRLGYLEAEQVETLLAHTSELGRMLTGLTHSLKSKKSTNKN